MIWKRVEKGVEKVDSFTGDDKEDNIKSKKIKVSNKENTPLVILQLLSGSDVKAYYRLPPSLSPKKRHFLESIVLLQGFLSYIKTSKF